MGSRLASRRQGAVAVVRAQRRVEPERGLERRNRLERSSREGEGDSQAVVGGGERGIGGDRAPEYLDGLRVEIAIDEHVPHDLERARILGTQREGDAASLRGLVRLSLEKERAADPGVNAGRARPLGAGTPEHGERILGVAREEQRLAHVLGQGDIPGVDGEGSEEFLSRFGVPPEGRQPVALYEGILGQPGQASSGDGGAADSGEAADGQDGRRNQERRVIGPFTPE